ncbi:GTPase [Candidatus Pelagibacter sp. HIMB1517]|uniref:GTPase n=1 Tax=Candidatus Pelagibacter sp. HIMB1517 TaxID=3413341 RepID=UPI003F859C6C
MNENFNVCIVGKPNVGKSTIFNKILDKDISKVGQVAGTTIYPISSSKEFKNININLIDLGGLKKKSKSYEGKQKLITSHTIKQINLSDVVFFILDGNDEITKNDKQLFRLILNKLKNVIVIVNKTDLIKENLKKKEDYFKFFFKKNYPNILLKPIFISALKNVKKEFLLKKIYELFLNTKKIIKNKDVNLALKNILEKHQPVYSKKSRPTIKFLRHVNSKPMIFKAFGNKLTSLSKDYKNFFIKQVLINLKIYNQIVVIKYLNNNNPYSKS